MVTDVEEVGVRRAVPGDARVLADLNVHVQRLHADAHPDQFSPEDHSAVQAFFDTALAGGPALAWIAELAEEPIGYLYAVEAHRDANPFTTEQHTLHVHHLAAAPTARRCGVGSSLLRTATEHARDAGLDGLLLDSWTFNAEAHAFFRRFGFEPMQTRFALRL